MRRIEPTAKADVIVDIHEGREIVDLLEEEGLTVDQRHLSIGDYLIGDYAVVERKTVYDFHLSLADGRLWLQLSGIRARARWPYLLVEGADLDRGPLGRRQVRGALLAAVDQRVRVLRSQDRADSARWLYGLAIRRKWRPPRIRPPYALGSSPAKSAHAAEAVLSAVPGISFQTARALLGRFGSVRDVLAAEPSEWLSVPGVGPRRAEALRQALMLSRPPAPAPPPALPAKAQPPST